MNLWNIPPPPPAATDRFGWIMARLGMWIGAYHVKEISGPLLWVITRHLGRMARRFAKLAAYVQTGTTPVPGPSRPRANRTAPRKPVMLPCPPFPPDTEAPAMPRGRSCLCAYVPQWAATAGAELRYLMDHPDMKVLVAADPRIARLCRQLLWMLGADIPPNLPPTLPPPRPAPGCYKQVRGAPGEPPTWVRRDAVGMGSDGATGDRFQRGGSWRWPPPPHSRESRTKERFCELGTGAAISLRIRYDTRTDKPVLETRISIASV